jgi:hypothetical protein
LFCIVDENDVVVWNEKKRERGRGIVGVCMIRIGRA